MTEYPENEKIRGLLAGRSADPKANTTVTTEECEALDLIQDGLNMYTQDSPQADTHTLRVGVTRNVRMWGSKYFVGCFKNGACVSECMFNVWGEHTIDRIQNWLQRFFKEA